MPAFNQFSTDSPQSDAMQRAAEEYVSETGDTEDERGEESGEDQYPDEEDRLTEPQQLLEVIRGINLAPTYVDNYEMYLAKAEKILDLCHGDFKLAKRILEVL